MLTVSQRLTITIQDYFYLLEHYGQRGRKQQPRHVIFVNTCWGINHGVFFFGTPAKAEEKLTAISS